MTKYYRVKKDTFMWLTDAIISDKGDEGHGYRAIEDCWNKVELKTEYISSHIVEDKENSDFFERVYLDTIKGNIYRTADKLRELYSNSFKD